MDQENEISAHCFFPSCYNLSCTLFFTYIWFLFIKSVNWKYIYILKALSFISNDLSIVLNMLSPYATSVYSLEYNPPHTVDC